LIRTLDRPDLVPIDNSACGGTVAVVGELEGDGIPDLAIASDGGPAASRIYLFSSATGSLLRTLPSPPDSDAGIFLPFGRSITGVGDINEIHNLETV
jgi:hypothetical protein